MNKFLPYILIITSSLISSCSAKYIYKLDNGDHRVIIKGIGSPEFISWDSLENKAREESQNICSDKQIEEVKAAKLKANPKIMYSNGVPIHTYTKMYDLVFRCK